MSSFAMNIERGVLTVIQLFLCYCFCVSGLIVNVLQFLTWIFIWPWSKSWYRRVNYHLMTLIWSRECCPSRIELVFVTVE